MQDPASSDLSCSISRTASPMSTAPRSRWRWRRSARTSTCRPPTSASSSARSSSATPRCRCRADGCPTGSDRNTCIVTIAMWSVFTVMTSFAWSLASLIVIRFIFGITEGAFRRRASRPSPSCSTSRQPPQTVGAAGIVELCRQHAGAADHGAADHRLGWRHAFEAIGIAGVAFAAGLLRRRAASRSAGQPACAAAATPATQARCASS